MPTNTININAKFHQHPCTNHRDITSHEISVNTQRTDGWTTRKHNALHLLVGGGTVTLSNTRGCSQKL